MDDDDEEEREPLCRGADTILCGDADTILCGGADTMLSSARICLEVGYPQINRLMRRPLLMVFTFGTVEVSSS